MSDNRGGPACIDNSQVWGLIFYLSPLLFLAVGPGKVSAQPETSVGMTGRIEALVLPGGELEAKPVTDRKSPVILQGVRVYPHGDRFRYDLDYTGLEPGTHDLRQCLRRKDGSPLGDLPSIPVVIKQSLPAGQVLPHDLELGSGPKLGGYRVVAAIAGIVWGAVLVGLIASFFNTRRANPGSQQGKPVSLAEKLRPLVEGALAGTLTQAELANLERGLFSWWRKRLGLENLDPAQAMEMLRQNPESGPLLNQLEWWLHRPGAKGEVDVVALLEPYRNLPVAGLDVSGGGE